MTQTSFPFEGLDTTETQFSRWARHFNSGVNDVPTGDAVEVSVGTGLAVDVEAGEAMVRGHYYISDATESLALATADATNDRVDLVVLKLDPVANSIVLAVKTGTPAGSPVAPTPVQTDAGIFEQPVAEVLVPANSGVPTTITDRREFMGTRLGSWSTDGRPLPAGRVLFGFNTDNDRIEYYDPQVEEWQDVTPASIGDIGDVDITSASSGEVLTYDGTNWVNSPASADGLFYKTDSNSVAFTAPTGSTVDIKAGTKLEVEGELIEFASATSVTMPSLTAGTDYYIYVDNTGDAEAVEATGAWPTPVAAEPADSRLIGGFHYAPGGNATGQSGGDTTPAINEYSFWDLKWRPVAPDPRGMTLVSNMFWADIYLLNRDPDTYGTSRNDQPIADGETDNTTTAIIPAAFGGNGSTRYSEQTWWNTAEALSAYGKRLPRYREHAAFAYGTTEAASRGNDPVTTGFGTTNTGSSNTDEKFTSKWGVIQASGVMRVWGDEFGGGNASSSWADITGGRGNVFQQENAVHLGGNWSLGANAGSRSALWLFAPSYSGSNFGGRGVCDHLTLV